MNLDVSMGFSIINFFAICIYAMLYLILSNISIKVFFWQVLLLNGTHDRETGGFTASCFVTAIADALNRTHGDPHNSLKSHVSILRYTIYYSICKM